MTLEFISEFYLFFAKKKDKKYYMRLLYIFYIHVLIMTLWLLHGACHCVYNTCWVFTRVCFSE